MNSKKIPSKTAAAKSKPASKPKPQPTKRKRKDAPPQPKEARRDSPEFDTARLIELRDSLRGECLVHEDVEAIRQKILTGARLLRNNEISAAPEYRQNENARRVLEEVGSEIVPALNGLLFNTLDAMLGIIKTVQGREAEDAAILLTDNLTRALHVLHRISGDERGRGLLAKAAGKRMHFPALASIIANDHERSQKLAREGLNLGGALPFKVDPDKKYNVFSLMAMEVVLEIEAARADHWSWRPGSVYRKVAPNLDSVHFRKGAAAEILWAKVIRFHVDFFQGPRPRRRKAAEDFAVEAELELFEARRDRLDLASFWAFGEIAKMRPFAEALKADKKAKTELGLFDRAKQKIIDRALELMPE
jgi:hypothetical protein